ncbi:hypothetical protein LG3211_3335 [Lysobacter gummosus]|nr:hypothetical protein LG3211_3335 [Lysobacter gummosus]
MNEWSGHAYRFCGRADGDSSRGSAGGVRAALQGISPAAWDKP